MIRIKLTHDYLRRKAPTDSSEAAEETEEEDKNNMMDAAGTHLRDNVHSAGMGYEDIGDPDGVVQENMADFAGMGYEGIADFDGRT